MSVSSSPQCVLVTLGRLPIALDVARGFHALGWRVIIAEPFGMHLARMSRSVARSYTVRAPKKDRQGYLRDIARVIEAERVNLVVPVSEESMHVSALYDVEGVSFFCMPQTQMLALHDKLAFNRTAAEYGLSVPLSCAADDARATDITSQSFVAKPRRSCSGRGVEFHEGGHSGAFPRDYVLQKRIIGTELSSFSLARDGVVLCTVVYQARATSGSVAVVFERVDERIDNGAGRDSSIDQTCMPGAYQPGVIPQWVSEFVAKSKHTGFISFDFIVDDTGTAYALECNPRATSGIHFVEPASLAQTIAEVPEPSLALRPYRLMQEGYSSYTALLGSITDSAERRKRWSLLKRARDVTWSRADPWPFLLMIVNTYRLVLLAVIKRETFAKVAALDIEWEEHDRP